MQVSDIDLRLLRVFAAVVEAGGFGAAETSLNIGTSTISIHISDLEKRVGFRLCDRGRSGFRLTERGRLVYEESKRLFTTLDDFTSTLAGMRDTLAGRLVIGSVDCLVTHPSFPVTRAIRRFNRTENAVEFELVVDSRQELERAVLDGRIHAAIGPFIRNISGLKFQRLFTERHTVYCGLNHPLFGLDAQEQKRHDTPPHSVILRTYHHDFDRSRFGVAKARAVVTSMEAMLVLLRSGEYLGYLPAHYAQLWVDRGELWRVPLPRMDYTSEHMLITRRAARDTELLSTFTSLLIAEATAAPVDHISGI
ncbi:DNA-binding transcriptional LysR family regulator [Rhodoligotrophos appendicifer]|uniref:LysR family transcriptional regulator n=1 Tax=Rhodoligotrophos appendicifer TaxID=987056 RepID=UPI00118590F3|nr:LysR family transcriptional regulator [Rhodoligotrophos appendicifer]